ncbi:uncharacterized protein N7496_009895 [Penicillium cataractarum]|uniref:Erythromycin esterase n=1 Tax=Penicillium cataractarum TaxID=2100454 RepID=A0A9W9V0C7_9EURO|nr:uncharacterized protein N7496_009895 [Penicillium cataractarum]KAJ5364182.1 hypothetical protein N7496_009895 [Penicillium cataractarum]
MAVRRSARLRSASAQPSPGPEAQESVPQPDIRYRLASVEERDETPADDHSSIRTPITKKSLQRTPTATSHRKMTDARTPTSNSAVRPPPEEMHPSKAQQSTAKKVDSGLILGFNPIQKDANGNIVKNSVIQDTPSKSKASPAPTQFGTPGYEFKRGQESQLSDEAKQLMDSVRGEVARIKAQMILDKSKQDQQDHEAENMHGDRRIAKPKGKAGRFSDVHMAEFKKMDSIAGHPSSFRAAPDRFQPVTKSLKRTKSKAQLDESEPQKSSPSRSSAKPSTETLSTTSTPTAKRAKPNPTADTSVVRPQVEAKVSTTQKPAGPRPRPRITSSLMTPTRASMARSGSVSIKAPKTSLIPSLARSPSTKGLASPRTPRTEFNPRFKSSLPTLNHLKSILRKRQPLFSRDPAKIAAGTHVAAPDFNPDSLFGTRNETTDSAPTPSPKKHVEFTPSVKSRYDLAHASPSRSKIPTTPSRSNLSDIVYPTLPTLTPDHNAAASSGAQSDNILSPTIRHVRKSNAAEEGSVYPELPVVAHGIAHGIGNKKRRRDEADDDDLPNAEDAENVPPADSLAGERSTKRLKKSILPTPSPIKSRPIKTPVRLSSARVGTPSSATASAKQKSRSVLSLSRLNMLAKPKGQA